MSARPAILLLTGTLMVLAVALAALALGQSARSAEGAPDSFPPQPAPATESNPQPEAEKSPPERDRNRTRRRVYEVAALRTTVALRPKPGGPVDTRLSARTEFGSGRVLGVAARRGRWLGLVTTARSNGRLAWADRRDPALRVGRVGWSLHADLSERSLELRRFGQTRRRLSVGIGAPGSPTPTGRFAVTDKLDGSRFGSYYGCCILALSGYQEQLPPGWQGGNRIAIHGTDAAGTIGAAATAGCLRAAANDLALLMRRVPLGTPVFIRA